MSDRFSSSSKLASTVLRRLKGAARKEKWGGSVIKLAWTAGPVTYLGLQGGYYIAYGETAPPAIFLYFAAYTLLAGILALVSRFVYNIARGSAKEEDLLILESNFNTLPQRIVEIRNLQLQSLDPLSRNVLTAKYLLENPQAGSDAVALAIKNITGDLELAEEMTALEVYRGNGLSYKAAEKSSQIIKLLEPHMESLNNISENVGQMILDRASEDTELKEFGRKRTTGFISRVQLASENDDLNYMTLQDAEEICILVYELLNSRVFPHYTTEYKGDKKYRETAQRLSKTRKDYRKHIYKRNNAIRVLAEELYKEKQAETKKRNHFVLKNRAKGEKRKGIQRLLASIPQIRSASTLQRRIVESIKELAKTKSYLQKSEWKSFQNLYRNLYKNVQLLIKSYRRFKKVWHEMQNLLDAQSYQICLISNSSDRRGISIQSSQVFLSDKKILPAARMIHEKLEEFNSAHENPEININDQKELAIDLFHIIDSFLPLEKTYVQRAIELTRSAYISRGSRQGIAQGFHSWSLNLVKGEEYPGKESLHEMIESLVKYEYLHLKDNDRIFLEETFGADPEFLSSLNNLEMEREDHLFPVKEPESVTSLEELMKEIS